MVTTDLGRKGTFIFENIYIIFVKITTIFDVFLESIGFMGKNS
jgi:hypothetical protein